MLRNNVGDIDIDASALEHIKAGHISQWRTGVLILRRKESGVIRDLELAAY